MRGSRQVGEKEFVDHPRTRGANGTLLLAGWMGRHHHTAQYAIGSHRHLWAVVEATHHLTFRALLELICWEMQTCLDERMIKHRVLLAACHKSEPRKARRAPLPSHIVRRAASLARSDGS